MNATILETTESRNALRTTDATLPAATSFALATVLFDEITALPKAPVDRAYSDMLLLAGLGALDAALAALPQTTIGLIDCAHAVGECTWIPSVVRTHISETLLGVADGSVSVPAARAFVGAAARRVGQDVLLDNLRAIGREGMTEIADAIGALTDAVTAARH